MIDIFPELPRPLGVYTLTRLLELRENTALYVAQQSHVERDVVLEVLNPGVSHDEEVAFLAQARLRVASSELPHVAHVFESLRAEGIWFLTQELPQGTSLAETAACGQSLSVPHICRVIAAAADMYTPCHQAELSAMPLAASSIFIEPDGDVHFLSPLVEGEPIPPAAQMSALAHALWPLVPQEKEPGLGRAVTLLQWLTEGYEGQLLEWFTLGDTARGILEQLQSEQQNTPQQRSLGDILGNKRTLRKLRRKTAHWGLWIGGSAAIILGMSSLGTLYGMADPVRIPAGNETAFLCRDGSRHERVNRHPVSVAEYEAFLREYQAMDDTGREHLLAGIPVQDADPTPHNWMEQVNRDDPGAPVTGVSYWQAHMYARQHGGSIPTAAQLQTVMGAGAPACDYEWSSTSDPTPLPGIYADGAAILIDSQSRPFPVESRTWQHPGCGFRISIPENR